MFKNSQFVHNNVGRVRELVDHLGTVLSGSFSRKLRAEDGLRLAREGISILGFVIDRVYWRTFGDHSDSGEDRGRNEPSRTRTRTRVWYRCVH